MSLDNRGPHTCYAAEVGLITRGSFFPFSVFLQALIQGIALVVNAIAEALAGLWMSIIGASVPALSLRIARTDVVHKVVDDDH